MAELNEINLQLQWKTFRISISTAAKYENFLLRAPGF